MLRTKRTSFSQLSTFFLGLEIKKKMYFRDVSYFRSESLREKKNIFMAVAEGTHSFLDYGWTIGGRSSNSVRTIAFRIESLYKQAN